MRVRPSAMRTNSWSGLSSKPLRLVASHTFEAAGICSVGVDVDILGVVPTPAVAYLVRKYKADAGIMISASHNPAEFNGIKIFSGNGFKLPDMLEEKNYIQSLDEARKENSYERK